MKRLFFILVTLMMLLSLSGCGGKGYTLSSGTYCMGAGSDAILNGPYITLDLEENTFSFHFGIAISHFLGGDIEVDGERVVATIGETEYVFIIKDNDTIVFEQEGCGDDMKIEDGTEFVRWSEEFNMLTSTPNESESINISSPIATYVYEKDGFGTPFTITINADGTFSYYEGALSSYIGFGEWKVVDNVLAISEDTGKEPRINYFEVDGNVLIFQEENSRGFIYIDVSDGDRFVEVFTESAADAGTYNMPKEHLGLDTELLLEKLIDSDFISRAVGLRGFSDYDEPLMEYNLNTHNGFKELLSRKDFCEVLEAYTKEIAEGVSELSKYQKMCFFEILKQNEVVELVEKAESKGEDLPYLYEWYETNDAK